MDLCSLFRYRETPREIPWRACTRRLSALAPRARSLAKLAALRRGASWIRAGCAHAARAGRRASLPSAAAPARAAHSAEAFMGVSDSASSPHRLFSPPCRASSQSRLPQVVTLTNGTIISTTCVFNSMVRVPKPGRFPPLCLLVAALRPTRRCSNRSFCTVCSALARWLADVALGSQGSTRWLPAWLEAFTICRELR